MNVKMKKEYRDEFITCLKAIIGMIKNKPERIGSITIDITLNSDYPTKLTKKKELVNIHIQ